MSQSEWNQKKPTGHLITAWLRNTTRMTDPRSQRKPQRGYLPSKPLGTTNAQRKPKGPYHPVSKRSSIQSHKGAGLTARTKERSQAGTHMGFQVSPNENKLRTYPQRGTAKQNTEPPFDWLECNPTAPGLEQWQESYLTNTSPEQSVPKSHIHYTKYTIGYWPND